MADIETLLQYFSREEVPRRTPTDSDWNEVNWMNSYAVFMGYISMAVRGMGFLALTWITVVLLGGFVTSLGKKDFWCLTAITFMQAAGVFDTSRKKRLSNITDSFNGLMTAVLATVTNIVGYTTVGFATAVILVSIQIVIYAAILCPIFALYISGPYVPIWLAVWRLRHRSYSNTNGEPSSANLQRALDVLYIVVVLQGVLVYYMTINAFSGKMLVQNVVKEYGFEKWASTTVWDYLDDTRKGCAKDPSFAEGRNLIKYAVDSIQSESADKKLSGLRILDTITRKLRISSWDSSSILKWKKLAGQHMLLKQLIIESESSDNIIQKLLEMLNSRSPYDKEMRKRAAGIVAHLAGDIHLKKFPLGIHWVASLLNTFEEYMVLEPYQRDWLLHTREDDWCQEAALAYKQEDEDTDPEEAYNALVKEGLCIIWRLASNKDNCVIMSRTPGLLSKIMAPVTNDLTHNHPDTLQGLVWASVRVMNQLVTAPGVIGRKLRSQISSNKEAIATMGRTLKCNDCSNWLCVKTIETLTELHIDTSSSMTTESRKNFMKTLLDIFLKEASRPVDSDRFWEEFKAEDEDLDKLHKKIEKGSAQRYLVDIFKAETDTPDIRDTAALALMRLSFKLKNSATIILQENDNIVNELKALLLSAEEKTYRRVAAVVLLERLCIYYADLVSSENGKYPDLNKLNKANLKEALVSTVPKVLQEILSYMPAEEMQQRTDTKQVRFPEPQSDIESQSGEPKDNGNQEKKSESNELTEKKKDFLLARKRQDAQNFMRRFIPASLSLCVTVCETLISADKDSTGLFDAITTACAATSVPSLLKDMVERNMNMVEKERKEEGMLGRKILNQAYYLKIVKLISKMVISMMKHGCNYDKEDRDSLVKSLSDASSKMSFLDGSMVFASNEDGPWRVWDSMLNRGEKKPRSLNSLVKEAEILNEKEKKVSDIIKEIE